MTTIDAVFVAGVEPANRQLVGNRLALAGVAMYFLEWVGIAAFNFVVLVLAAPVGVSVLAASIAMVRSRLYPGWLSWLGVAAGLVTCIYGVIAGPAFAAGGTCQSALCATGSALPGIAQTISVTLVAAWIWMIATGVVLFRAAGRQRQ